MGFFGIFKKKNSGQPADKKATATGWDAIEKEAGRIYPGQTPLHYGTIIRWNMGGNDPLEGISVYDGGDYLHFVTFGLSELYNKESDDPTTSGYGMEFTFRLKKEKYEDGEAEIRNVCGILQLLARITFTKGEIFSPYEYVYSGQTSGADSKGQSAITGFITVPDPLFKSIMTPNGRVDFTEFVGVTNDELLRLENKETDVKTLYRKLGSDITDYKRSSVI